MKYIMPDEPWTVRDENFPRDADRSEQLKFLLNYAILAPSIYNTQPWQFKVTGSEVAMYLDRSRMLPVCDPLSRNLTISCGAALYHLRIAIHHFGYEPVVRTFPDLSTPNLLALIRLGERNEVSHDEHRLFSAIRKRRTIRSRFLPKALPAGVVRQLQEGAEEEGARINVLREPSQQRILLDLVREAADIRTRDAAFKQELYRWTNRRWAFNPTGQMKYPAPPAGTAAPPDERAIQGLDPRQLSAWEEELETGEPILVVLGTVNDQMPGWLSAGQAMGRVLLTAAKYDLNAAFLNQPVGIEHLRARLRTWLGDESYPQVILRIGYGAPAIPTRRLPVQRVTQG